MSKSGFNRSAGLAAAGAALLVLGAWTDVAEARERPGARAGAAVQRGAGPQRPMRAPVRRGDSWTRTTEHQRTETGRTRRDQWQHEDGRTVARDVTVVNDRDAGTRTRSADWTGPNGGTGSVDTVTSRTDTGFNRNTTVTNARGETATRDMTVVRDPAAGTRSVDIERTGFDGRTSSVRSDAQRTDDGFTRNTTVTTPAGQTHTRSVDVSCDKASKSCTRTVDHNGGANGG